MTGSSRRSKWMYHLHTSEPRWERYAQDIMWTRWDPYQATWRRASTQDAMCPWHLINPREALPDELDAATCSAQGFKGPQPRAISLQLTHTSGTALRTHLAVTQTKGSAIGADPGSTEPTLRWFMPIFHVSSPRWILSTFQECSGCSRADALAYK
jgi:hypothetical protein